ncbi:MAG: tetratricopeptide repeat protein [Acidobacteriota bacterium]
MKIETIVTAIIFFSVGFLAGFIFKSQRQAGPQAQAAVAAAATPSPAASSAGPAGMGSGNSSIDPATGLPNGHPPLEVAEIIQNYEQRATQNPKDAQIPLRLANYLYDKHYFNLAIQWYQRSLTLDPKDVNARTDLGTSYFYAGQPQKAVAEYKRALALNPKHQPTLFNMIVVNLEGIHNVHLANQYWAELNRLNPNYPGLKEIKGRLDTATRSSGNATKP